MPEFDFAPEARYSCVRCAAGCRAGWHIFLTPEERERLTAHDWAAESPRLSGLTLFEEIPNPGQKGGTLVRVAKHDGACVFLDPDNLCFIHKQYGLEYKPGLCQQYPFHFVQTPDAVTVALDFACTSVLTDEGTPLAEQPADIEAAYQAEVRRAADFGTMGVAARAAVAEQLWLQPRQPLHWENYRALNLALQDILHLPGQPLEQRLLRMDGLLQAAIAAHGQALGAPSAALMPWLQEQRARGYAPPHRTVTVPRSPMRQRAVLAPFLAGIEQQWRTWGVGGGSTSERLTMAIIITNGVGPLPLASLGATLELRDMRPVAFPDAEPELDQLATRYLKGVLRRHSLVDGTDVVQGWRYLLLTFAAARWYAVARAALASRAAVDIDDLRHGIRTVERALGHAIGLKQGSTQRIVRLLYRHVGSPATMIHNYHAPQPSHQPRESADLVEIS